MTPLHSQAEKLSNNNNMPHNIIQGKGGVNINLPDDAFFLPFDNAATYQQTKLQQKWQRKLHNRKTKHQSNRETVG